ncbi:glycosyltransferase family 2 protein [Streptomyces chartreusis]
MDDEISVSVIIVNWNAGALIDKCLASLAELPDDAVFEVIVADNASSDGSVELLRERWPGVFLIPLSENLGFGAANNIAFTHARGQFILILNPDTVAFPGMLDNLLKVLKTDATVGCVGARHVNPDMSLQWSMDNFPTLVSDALNYSDLHRLPFLHKWLVRTYPRWSDHTVERDVDWVNGACMLVRREVFVATEGFDEYFFLFHEELDWCRRIWQEGWRVRFVPSAMVVHMLGGTFAATDVRRFVLIYQSSLRYYSKNKSLPSLFGIHAFIRVNAVVRLFLVACMVGWEGVTRRLVTPKTWEIITQCPVRIPYTRVFLMWWMILNVRTQATIRPSDPTLRRPPRTVR